MANGGPPAPQPYPVIPPAVLTAPPVEPQGPSMQPIIPSMQTVQPAPIPQLNWSHFKAEFAGKPDEDVEAHLLRTNDWIDTNAFPEGGKVQRFHLTLVG